MKTLLVILNLALFSGGAVAFLFGAGVWSQAPSAIQEIGALTLLLISAVLFVGGAWMAQMWHLKSEIVEKLQEGNPSDG